MPFMFSFALVSKFTLLCCSDYCMCVFAAVWRQPGPRVQRVRQPHGVPRPSPLQHVHSLRRLLGAPLRRPLPLHPTGLEQINPPRLLSSKLSCGYKTVY